MKGCYNIHYNKNNKDQIYKNKKYELTISLILFMLLFINPMIRSQDIEITDANVTYQFVNDTASNKTINTPNVYSFGFIAVLSISLFWKNDSTCSQSHNGAFVTLIKTNVATACKINLSKCKIKEMKFIDIHSLAIIVPFIVTISLLLLSADEKIKHYLWEHFSEIMSMVVSISTVLIPWIMLKRKAQKDWENQHFLRTVQFSLNYVDDVHCTGDLTLCFRSLDECSVDELMNHNQQGISQIVAACEACTEEQPFVVVSDLVQVREFNTFMKAIVNRISVKFGSGYLDYNFHIPVIKKEYWLGLTCEKPTTDSDGDGVSFARKIRIMVCSDEFLKSIPNFMDKPKFEFPTHAARWDCMKQMYNLYKKDSKIEEQKGNEDCQKLTLRKVAIFRAMQYPYEHDENVRINLVSKGQVLKKVSL